MRGHHRATQGKVVLPSVYVLDEETWRTEELILEEGEKEIKEPR